MDPEIVSASKTELFSHRRARSTLLLAILAVLVIVETAALHFILRSYSPLLAVILSLLSLSALGWLAADYIALGTGQSSITESDLVLRVGKRLMTTIPLDHLQSAAVPTWQDIPSEPDKFYLNATKPAEPNILIEFHKPVSLKVLRSLPKKVKRLALCVDEPERFLSALNAASASSQSTSHPFVIHVS